MREIHGQDFSFYFLNFRSATARKQSKESYFHLMCFSYKIIVQTFFWFIGEKFLLIFRFDFSSSRFTSRPNIKE